MQDPREIINQLSPEDALAVLHILADGDPELAAHIAEIALARLRHVDADEIAACVYDGLEWLQVEEVWDRAGQKRDGYVETSEAAYQMVEEVLEPFLADLKKYQQLGMMAEATQVCMGIVAGLYQFEHECKTQFKDWAPDAAISFAEEVVDAWKANSPSRADIKALKAFIAENLGGWGARLM